MLRDIWVTSDTHFNHDNILTFVENGVAVRDFDSIQEMNERIIDNWNSVVKDGDIVYHLGDVYFKTRPDIDELLGRLKGRKRLVLGNHDSGKDKHLLKHFQKIVMWRKFDGVVLTHVPVHPSVLSEARFKDGDIVNVHGHLHTREIHDPRYMNVCVEQTNYTPVNIEGLGA